MLRPRSIALALARLGGLPRPFPLYQEKGLYGIGELQAWFADQAAGLATRFDQRNGNKFMSRQINQLKKLHDLAKPFPLK